MKLFNGIFDEQQIFPHNDEGLKPVYSDVFSNPGLKPGDSDAITIRGFSPNDKT